LKKVLILSYFFPPCNLTASQRAFGWAKYLKEYGYEPIVLTRNWDVPIKNSIDAFQSSGYEIRHEKNENFEAYYLPYKSTLRDKILIKYGGNKFNLIRKILTFFELIFQNFTNAVVPCRNIHEFADNYLKENEDIDLVLISAQPFILFRFGYLLKKNHNIKWLADYRDDWNTTEIDQYVRTSSFEKILEKYSEKKWISSSEIITTISDYYAQKISKFTNKKATVLLNGYFEDDFNLVENNSTLTGFKTLSALGKDDFIIVYNGSLYPTQKIEIFLNALKKLIKKNDTEINKIKIIFPGLEYDNHQSARVSEIMKDYKDNIITTPRISKKETIALQSSAHLLLMIAHENVKGIPSSKLYEYIALGKPTIACPLDNDIIENTLKNYNLGYICNDENEAFEVLENLYKKYLNGEYAALKPDTAYQKLFSRKEQTKILAEILNQF